MVSGSLGRIELGPVTVTRPGNRLHRGVPAKYGDGNPQTVATPWASRPFSGKGGCWVSRGGPLHYLAKFALPLISEPRFAGCKSLL
jgi:hypothetical protein